MVLDASFYCYFSRVHIQVYGLVKPCECTSNLKPHTFPSFRHLDALYMVLSNEYFRNLSLDGYLNLVEAVDTRKRPFMHVALDGIQS